MTFVKEMNAREALEFWSRLTHRGTRDYNDHNMERQYLRNYLKRTGQTELMDMHGLLDWFKEPGLNKKTFKIELSNTRCKGNRMMIMYLMRTQFTRA